MFGGNNVTLGNDVSSRALVYATTLALGSHAVADLASILLSATSTSVGCLLIFLISSVARKSIG